MEEGVISMEILDRYISQLLENSTPECPAWFKEKREEGCGLKWNYIDGCMIKAVLELYHMNQDTSYLEFADGFIDRFVNEDGSIVSYRPEDYNLDKMCIRDRAGTGR